MGHKTHVLAERQNQHALTCERGGKGNIVSLLYAWQA